MLEAALWGLVGGLALVLGAVIALMRRRPVASGSVAYVMAFGAGVLISAVAFDLTEEAFEPRRRRRGRDRAGGGALVYFGRRTVVKPPRGGGEDDRARGSCSGRCSTGSPSPRRSGSRWSTGGGVSVSFLIAVFISNLPESISSIGGARARRARQAVDHSALWLGIALASALAAGLGYQLLGDAIRRRRWRRQGVRGRRDPVHARRHA